MNTSTSTRVLLLDDQGLVRRGIKTLLQLTDPTIVVDESSTLADALEKLEASTYDFSFVDLDLSGEESGLDLITKMHELNRGLPAIVLSGNDDRETIMKCIEYGASGFITKAAEDESVFRTAIETVLAGRVYLPSKAVGRGGHSPLASKAPKSIQLRDLGLKPKLNETLVHLYHGLRNKEIAKQMNISEYTARDYCSELYEEFGVTGRAQLIVELARRGITIPISVTARQTIPTR